MKIGFIGTGNMGNPFAQHLLEAGNEMVVHDLSKERARNLLEMGASWADTPAGASSGQDVVFTSLPGPRQVETVVFGKDGVLDGARPPCVYVDLTTNSLAMVKRAYQAFRERGMQMLDAPVSGGVKGAVSRDLIVMASGDEAVFEKVRPLLDVLGDKVTYCGPIGNGTICKLCHNLMSAGITQVVTEVLTLGVKAGVPLATLADAIREGASGKVPPLTNWYATTFRGVFEGTSETFYLELMRKDVGLATEMGRDIGVPMEIASLVEQRYIDAMNRGWGRMASNAVVRLQEERTHTELRLPPNEDS